MFSNVWGFGYDDLSRRNNGFTKEDCRKLQVLQNKISRLKTGLHYKTSTDSLLKASKDLSVQQLTALQTLISVHKIKKKGKPEYLNEKLKLNESVENVVTPRRQVRKIYVDQKLTLSRAGFI